MEDMLIGAAGGLVAGIGLAIGFMRRPQRRGPQPVGARGFHKYKNQPEQIALRKRYQEMKDGR